MTTDQEIFDTAVVGVIQQGGASVNGSGSCAYRGTDGRKCAVGFLLTDEEAARCEGFGVSTLSWAEKLPQRLVDHLYVLERVQQAHDEGNRRGCGQWFLRYFVATCRDAARELGLSTKAMEAAAKEAGL